MALVYYPLPHPLQLATLQSDTTVTHRCLLCRASSTHPSSYSCCTPLGVHRSSWIYAQIFHHLALVIFFPSSVCQPCQLTSGCSIHARHCDAYQRLRLRGKVKAFPCQVQHPQASGSQENILQCCLDALSEILKAVRHCLALQANRHYISLQH